MIPIYIKRQENVRGINIIIITIIININTESCHQIEKNK